MEINSKIGKIVGGVLVLFLFWFLYDTFFAGIAEKKSNEALVRAQLADFAKAIAINQDDTGNYGVVSQKLPFIGCELPNSYLDSDEAKSYIDKLSKNKILCITDGANGVITKWAIAAELDDGSYWCVDEVGSRKKIFQQPTTAYCN